MTKSIKRVKDYSYREWLEELELTTLLEECVRGDLIEAFKIVKRCIFIMVDVFFNVSPWIVMQISKTKSTNQLDLLLIEWYILETNCEIGSKTALMKKIFRLNKMISEKEIKRIFSGIIRWNI